MHSIFIAICKHCKFWTALFTSGADPGGIAKILSIFSKPELAVDEAQSYAKRP